ncbi:MAG: cytochrome c [Nitrospinae bacterium]|nr:cytochrome c [Nitrospinota bacterium]
MRGMMRGGSQKDGRTSLNNPPMMREHHLSIMREHLEAVTEITGLVSTGDYDKASRTAAEKIGLTPEMRRMCDMMGDKQFRAMGIAFHQSADRLSEVLKKKDPTAALAALHETLNLCVACHASYRE